MANEARDFKCDIIESSRELTPKERVAFKDTQDAISINQSVADAAGDGVLIEVTDFVKLHIHNEKATPNKDYDVLVLLDRDGEKWTTGSESFMRQFESIWEDMKETGEEWSIKAYGRPSKNYAGRDFITCSVV